MFRKLSLIIGILIGGSTIPTLVRAETVQLNSIPAPLVFQWTGNERVISSDTIASWFNTATSLHRSAQQKTEAIAPEFCEWSYGFCDFAFNEQSRFSLRNTSSFFLDEDSLKQFLETLREETRIAPLDAQFIADKETNKVTAFSPSRDGNEIDVERSMNSIKQALLSGKTSKSLSIETTTINPKVSETDADQLGIASFLGEGRTNFAGSPKNRIHNIKRALEQYQGILIAPGEEFSFVKFLGDVDGEHGYLPELVIKRGKTEPEFGGGICQVSTTMFRAALNTGMKITARRNHAYPVSYYKPYGMDATIYIPSPDFRFINNTPAHILIQGAVEGTNLVFRFYGTSDGRSISIDGPHILESNPDGSLKTIFNQKVTDKNGTIFIDDDFRSSYESPSKYPHPGAENFTSKPKDWSEKQWIAYQASH